MNLGISGVKVYPNPVNDFLTIELFSAEGKLVLSKTEATSTMRIDMQGFASGVYTLKVVGNGKRDSSGAVSEERNVIRVGIQMNSGVCLKVSERLQKRSARW